MQPVSPIQLSLKPHAHLCSNPAPLLTAVARSEHHALDWYSRTRERHAVSAIGRHVGAMLALAVGAELMQGVSRSKAHAETFKRGRPGAVAPKVNPLRSTDAPPVRGQEGSGRRRGMCMACLPIGWVGLAQTYVPSGHCEGSAEKVASQEGKGDVVQHGEGLSRGEGRRQAARRLGLGYYWTLFACFYLAHLADYPTLCLLALHPSRALAPLDPAQEFVGWPVRVAETHGPARFTKQ